MGRAWGMDTKHLCFPSLHDPAAILCLPHSSQVRVRPRSHLKGMEGESQKDIRRQIYCGLCSSQGDMSC